MNKYIPNNIEEINIDNKYVKIINSYIENNKLFFIIHGNQLSGKTTLVNILLNTYYGSASEAKKNILYFNILKDQGINYFRNDLKNYCQINNVLISNNKKLKKTIIFDDIDILNDQCQVIISTLINNYKNINFILTCNDINKINNSIIHILEKINLNPINNEYLLEIYNKISKIENINLNKNDIDFLITSSNFSISKLINHINKIKIMKDKYTIKNEISNILINDFFQYIELCKKEKYKESIDYILNIYYNGYSVIDILDEFYNYIKLHSNIKEENKYKILKYVCNYINIFNNIHEHQIELIFLTNNIINVLKSD
jgi:DNA polymerase III delta prime subunit